MADPTKCARCGAVPRAAIHHDEGFEDFHAFRKLTIVSNHDRSRSVFYWLIAIVVIGGATWVAVVGWYKGGP